VLGVLAAITGLGRTQDSTSSGKGVWGIPAGDQLVAGRPGFAAADERAEALQAGNRQPARSVVPNRGQRARNPIAELGPEKPEGQGSQLLGRHLVGLSGLEMTIRGCLTRQTVVRAFSELHLMSC